VKKSEPTGSQNLRRARREWSQQKKKKSMDYEKERTKEKDLQTRGEWTRGLERKVLKGSVAEESEFR